MSTNTEELLTRLLDGLRAQHETELARFRRLAAEKAIDSSRPRDENIPFEWRSPEVEAIRAACLRRLQLIDAILCYGVPSNVFEPLLRLHRVYRSVLKCHPTHPGLIAHRRSCMKWEDGWIPSDETLALKELFTVSRSGKRPGVKYLATKQGFERLYCEGIATRAVRAREEVIRLEIKWIARKFVEIIQAWETPSEVRRGRGQRANKQDAIYEARALFPTASKRRLARIVGVAESTVRRTLDKPLR